MKKFLLPTTERGPNEDSGVQKGTGSNWEQLELEEKQKSLKASTSGYVMPKDNHRTPKEDGEVTDSSSDKSGVQLPEYDPEAAKPKKGKSSSASESGSEPSDADAEADVSSGTFLPGTGVFLSPKRLGIPSVLHLLVRRFRAVPKTIIFFTVESTRIPVVMQQHRIKVISYSDNIWRVIVRCGYAETRCDVLKALRDAEAFGLPKQHINALTFFVNSESIHAHLDSKLSPRAWLRFIPMRMYKLLKSLFRGTLQPMKLPEGMTVELSSRVVL